MDTKEIHENWCSSNIDEAKLHLSTKSSNTETMFLKLILFNEC